MEPPRPWSTPARLALDPLGSSRQVTVKEHGEKDRRTKNGLQPKPIDPQELHPVLQNSEDYRAQSRAINRSAASEDADSPHHHGRNRLKMEIGSDHGIHRSKASTPEDTDQAAQKSGQDENQGDMPPVA